MLPILMTRTYYGTTHDSTFVFDLAELSLDPSGWVAEMIAYHSQLSMRERLYESGIRTVHGGMLHARASVDWVGCANVPAAEISFEGLLAAFRAFEKSIDKMASAYSVSSNFRSWCWRFSQAKGLPYFGAVRRSFRSAYRPKYSPRKLISDFSQDDYPIGAMSHSTTEELRANIGKRLERTLDSITSAALEDLKSAEMSREKFLEEVIDNQYDVPAELRMTPIQTGVYMRHAASSWFKSAPIPSVVSAYYMTLTSHLEESDSASSLFPHRRNFCGSVKIALRPSHRWIEICKHLESRHGYHGHKKVHVYTALVSILCGGFRQLVACALLLQIRTGWNISAVLSLTSQEIAESIKNGVLQGFKSKIGDYTPAAILGKGDEHIYVALNYLLKRYRYLQILALTPREDHSVWLAFTSISVKASMPSAWGSALSRFCDHYDLRRFTFEQIRNEKLTFIANGKGGLEAAKEIGGHVDISSTGNYVDQLIMRRRNSAISLRFQQSLQASVEYRFKGSSVNPSLVNNLLMPVGDGASCINPRSPPAMRYLLDGVCEGKWCHVNGGCPNREIVIDDSRIEELVRFEMDFELRWKQLLAENQEKFEKYYLPAWLFNQALKGVIAAGPYRNKLKKIRSEIRGINGTS